MSQTPQVRKKTYDLVYISIFVVLIAICSWISIPLQVPFTMQTFGVFVTVGILGGRRGTVAVLVYILLGAVGVPVFAGFSGGIGNLLQSSGGYILGFLLSALIMWAMEKILGRSLLVLGSSMVLGLLACYAAGTCWFAVVYGASTGPVGIGTILGWCVIPFVIPDLLKIALALVLTKRLSGMVRR